MQREEPEVIALIGLGLLGSALAERLLGAGYQVRGYDVNPDCMEALAQLGGEAAPSPAAVAEGATVVLTCLMTSEIVWEAVVGPEGAVRGMARGSVLVDVSTCSPAASRLLAAELAPCDIAMLDAPLSGSSQVARAGELLAMVGGPEDAFERCRPVLAAFASRIVRVGESGAGSTAKLVTNLVLGLNRLALAEGLALGLRAGLEPEALLELLGESAAYSRVLDQKGQRMVTGEFAPEARLAQHLKDVRLILELGEDLGAALPVSALHEQLLTEAVTRGLGELDNSAIMKLF
jgi:3-hydroxyisobutyrate dehydrogenase-like beta-hydroxyacid dehydrogenase